MLFTLFSFGDNARSHRCYDSIVTNRIIVLVNLAPFPNLCIKMFGYQCNISLKYCKYPVMEVAF